MSIFDSLSKSRKFTNPGDEVIFDTIRGYGVVMALAFSGLICATWLTGFGLHKIVAINWPLVFTSLLFCLICTFVANREGRIIVIHNMQTRDFGIIQFNVFGFRKDSKYRFDDIRVIFFDECGSAEGAEIYYLYIELKNSVKFVAGTMTNEDAAAKQVERMKVLYSVV
jgi:hypothetical protein